MKRQILLLIGIVFINVPSVQKLQAQVLSVNYNAMHRHRVVTGSQQDTAIRPLEAVLEYLRKAYDVHFIYEDKLVHDKKVSFSDDVLEDKDIKSVLKRILRPAGLKCVKLSDGNYAIVRRVALLPAITNSRGNADSPAAHFDSGTVNVAFLAGYRPVAHFNSSVNREITGKVFSSRDGTPLEGVTIMVKNTRIATYTNADGVFRLTIPDGAQELIIRYLGYESKSIRLSAAKTFYNIELEPAVKGLNEVVVNGIFERPVSNYTGAARSFTAAQLRQIGNKNVLSALKSMDPSFRIPTNLNFGSDPNHLPQVQMRGANNLQDLGDEGGTAINLRGEYRNNPNLPLFILDGFQVSLQKIYDLDMNRIAKVTLLKDAAATAIYGSKAANGVVVIDTKHPEKGKLRLSYSGNFTLTAPDLSSYHLLNAKEKLHLEKIAGIYKSTVDEWQQYLDELYNQRLKEVQRGVNTYWLSQPLRTSFGHKHSIYLEGGNEVIRYGVDATYNDDNAGVMKGSHRTNYSGGTFLSYRHGNLLFRNTLHVISNHSVNSPYGSFGDYSKLNHYWRIRDSSGRILKKLETFEDYFYSRGSDHVVYNPLYRITLNSKNFSRYLNVTDNFQMEWRATKALKVKAQFSFYSQKSRYERFISGLDNQFADYNGDDYFRRGRYTIENGNQFNYQGTLTLNYGKAFGKNVLYATGGMQIDNDRSAINGMVAEGFPNDRLDDIAFAHQYQKDSKPYGSESLSRSVGFLANASYAYDNRYLLDASFRMDGSSKFGSDRRFAPFWSIGAGWNMQNENFMKELTFIDRLKLRGSFGSTGSQNFPSYMAMTTYGYNTGERYRVGIGATLLGLGNPFLEWEQTYKTNVGADLQLLQRINLSVNYYVEESDGLITDITTPPSLGFNSYKANLGKVENKGIEAYLTAFLIKNERKGFFWSVTANLFHNESRILEISDALKQQNEEQLEKQQAGDDPVTTPVILYKEGQSPNTIFAVRSKGIDPSTGREIFVKKDGSLTYEWKATDEVPVGNTESDVYGTFGTNFMYRGFSLNIRFRTELGGQLYNSTLANRVENANLIYNVDYRVLEKRWQKPGDLTQFKGLVDVTGTTRNDHTKATSRFVQDNNTLYCDVITLGYELPHHLVERWNMSRVQTYFYFNRPFVVSSIKQERGLSYPFARNFSLSLHVTF